MKGKNSELAEALVNLEEKRVLEMVQKQLNSGKPAREILNQLKEGMDNVGKKYEEKEYFLSDLVMAAEIFKLAMEIIEPKLEISKEKEKGTIVIGTVKGDLHDIGKNIMVALLKNDGFTVHDLGTDVPPDEFIRVVKREKAQVLGLSGILTMAVEPMKETVETLKREGLRKEVKVILGGLPVDEKWKEIAGADAFTQDAYEGLRIIKEFLGVR
ncbi:MAG: cobalamin B12-binding domain-containing protein [Candidatus Jordarchaeum sp.]|uniref:cobalamin B12-binding domain-containing protein n=1 Tax=Candidatus Jordarchaeum sp. TaxID=2823881 RepID=UPI00404B0AE4